MVLCRLHAYVACDVGGLRVILLSGVQLFLLQLQRFFFLCPFFLYLPQSFTIVYLKLFFRISI